MLELNSRKNKRKEVKKREKSEKNPQKYPKNPEKKYAKIGVKFFLSFNFLFENNFFALSCIINNQKTPPIYT